jgi:hypothetical protein
MKMLRDILYSDAETYELGKEFYISYKIQFIYKSTLIQLGARLIEKTNDFKELWMIQSKNTDTYWIIEDVRAVDPIVYKCYKSPF